jgi:hypothetical protein
VLITKDSMRHRIRIKKTMFFMSIKSAPSPPHTHTDLDKYSACHTERIKTKLE